MSMPHVSETDVSSGESVELMRADSPETMFDGIEAGTHPHALHHHINTYIHTLANTVCIIKRIYVCMYTHTHVRTHSQTHTHSNMINIHTTLFSIIHCTQQKCP